MADGGNLFTTLLSSSSRPCPSASGSSVAFHLNQSNCFSFILLVVDQNIDVYGHWFRQVDFKPATLQVQLFTWSQLEPLLTNEIVVASVRNLFHVISSIIRLVPGNNLDTTSCAICCGGRRFSLSSLPSVRNPCGLRRLEIEHSTDAMIVSDRTQYPAFRCGGSR